MKKKLLALMLVTVMAVAATACGSQQPAAQPDQPDQAASTGDVADEGESSGGYRIGFAFYNLQNPVWAEVVEEAVSHGTALGLDVTFVDAANSAQQISQMENFIQSGVDAIVVLAVDNESIEGVAREAMDEGIMVVDYSRSIENAHVTLNLNPFANAVAIVAMAEPFIRDRYGDGEFEWAHLDIPTVEVGVLQGNAIEAEMLRVFPNSRLVFNGATLTTEEGMNNTEAAIQANPNLRVILSQSAGGGVGGNEAIKAAVSPDEYDEWLLFSIDATEQEVVNILAGDPQKASISLGGGAEHGRLLIDLALRVLAGERFEGDDRIVPLPPTPITIENAQAFFDEAFGS